MAKQKKLGLALGAGGARGLAHIGVIKALLKEDIKIDMIAGTSMGAMVGGLYAAFSDVEKLEEAAEGFGIKDWFSMFVDPTRGAGLIKGDKMEQKIREMTKGVKIEDLKMPFRAVATDLNTAEKIIIDKGDLAKGIRASGSVPVLFEPVKIDGRVLVDGGVSCPVPVEIVREMGAEIVLAVNLDAVYFLQGKNDTDVSAFDVMKNTLFLLRYHLAEKETRDADLVIKPEIPYVSDLDFINKSELIEGGEKSTRKIINELKEMLIG